MSATARLFLHVGLTVGRRGFGGPAEQTGDRDHGGEVRRHAEQLGRDLLQDLQLRLHLRHEAEEQRAKNAPTGCQRPMMSAARAMQPVPADASLSKAPVLPTV